MLVRNRHHGFKADGFWHVVPSVQQTRNAAASDRVETGNQRSPAGCFNRVGTVKPHAPESAHGVIRRFPAVKMTNERLNPPLTNPI